MAHQPQNFVLNPGAGLPIPAAAYTNGVQIIASQWDLTILFFHTIPTGPANEQGEMPAEQRVVQGVVMSPQHAKAVALVLDKNVRAWEEQNGEVELPEEVRAGLGLDTG